jgi:hypothetical protein
LAAGCLEDHLGLFEDMGADKEGVRRMEKYLSEFVTYIENNRAFIPDYGERYRNGDVISTAFVESTVNEVVSRRFVKKQQMQWSAKGAHLLLQTRVRVLNEELESTFRDWYPKFRGGELSAAPMLA